VSLSSHERVAPWYAPRMHRVTTSLALLAALSLAACHTAASARQAALRRGLDQAEVRRSPAEIWPEVQRFLSERGYPLVGDDRVAIGQKPQGAIGRALARGFETKVRPDGGRVLETDQDRQRLRVRAEARPTPAGGTAIRLTLLKEMELNSMEVSEQRDEDLELALLRRLDPAVAAGAAGEAVPPGAASAAPVQDPWAAVRFLAGPWQGRSLDGADVRWTFTFTEGGGFLEVRGTPLLFAGPTARPGAGEELGRISRDPSGDGLSWSQFTYGGQVDRWRSKSAAPGVVVFAATSLESLPPGSRAQLVLRAEGPDAIVALLDLGAEGKELASGDEVRLLRAR
jgi:hypothetical protein